MLSLPYHRPRCRRLLSDLAFYTWRLRKPNKHDDKAVYLRAEETSLRSSPGEVPNESLKLKFGAEAVSVDESGDWIKIVSAKPRMRGWVHRYCVTNSQEQIGMLEEQDRVPKLILLFTVDNKGSLQGTTIAGYGTVALDAEGNTEWRFNPGDCLAFEKTSEGKFPKPLKLSRGVTIDEPRVDKIYMVDASGIVRTYDIGNLR